MDVFINNLKQDLEDKKKTQNMIQLKRKKKKDEND